MIITVDPFGGRRLNFLFLLGCLGRGKPGFIFVRIAGKIIRLIPGFARFVNIPRFMAGPISAVRQNIPSTDCYRDLFISNRSKTLSAV